MKNLSDGLNFIKKYGYFMIIIFILTVGIFSRLEVYLLNRQLYADEAFLVNNFFEHSGFLWVFGYLNHHQVAPPLFLLIIQSLTKTFDTSEYAFRLLPFVVSVCSVPAFYFLSKKILKSNRAVLLANFLFNIHYVILRYSVEIKQYSLDILIFMLVLMWLSNIKPDGFNSWRIMKYGIIFTFLCFLSQPVIFLLFGFIVYNILQNPKNYKICLIAILPLVCILIYKFSMPVELRNFMNYHWNNVDPGFISLKNFAYFVKYNYNFYLANAMYLKWLLLFVAAGFVISLFKKSAIIKILLFSILGAVLASVLKLYPLAGRTVLYLVPYTFILIAVCFDFELPNKNINKILSASVIIPTILITLLFQLKIFSKSRLIHIVNISQTGQIISILRDNYKENENVIITPGFQKSLYQYYSIRLNFNPASKNLILINFYDKNLNINKINSLPKNQIYWLCLPGREKANKELLKWLDNQDIFYEIKLGRDEYLYKIRINNEV